MNFRSDDQRKAMFAAISGRNCHNSFTKRKLYHGTAGIRGYAISKEGLIPPAEKGESFGCGGEFSDPNCVYVTGDKDVAKTFANAMADKFGGKPYVFEYEDDPDLSDEYLLDIEGFRDSWRHKGKIPPEKLKESVFAGRPNTTFFYPKDFNPPDNFRDIVREVTRRVLEEDFRQYGDDMPYFDPSSDRDKAVITGMVAMELDSIWKPEWGNRPHGRYLRRDVESVLKDLM